MAVAGVMVHLVKRLYVSGELLTMLISTCLLTSPFSASPLSSADAFNGGGGDGGGAECGVGDFEYHYTECDSRGERWRFAAPKSSALRCKNVPPPMSGLNCSFSCPAGHYLDLQSQKCRQCSPGTYSLGDGVRYEQMSKMPSGFTVENFPDETEQFLSDSNGGRKSSNFADCSNQIGWTIQNGELRYLPTPCVSKLSISLNLVHDGYIQFHYKMPKNGRSLLAILQVRNAFCQSYGDPRSMFFHSLHRFSPQSADMGGGGGAAGTMDEEISALSSPQNANNGEFQIRRIRIRAGQNLLTWTVANNRALTTLADIIYVSKIDIIGLAYTPVCSSCPAGTFSAAGAQKCELCEADTFSAKGASRCARCQPHEYSGPKAAKCVRRPKCDRSDYFVAKSARCASNGTQTAPPPADILRRVQPEICEEDALFRRDSIAAEAEATSRGCGACRAGMARSSATGLCEFCGVDEFSADGSRCSKCPPNTMPLYGLFFDRWDVLPSEMKTTCEYLFAGQKECNFSPTWIARGDRVESAQTRARGVALSLGVEVASGFFDALRSGGMGAEGTPDNPIAQLTLDLETKCAEPSCQLYFVQERINTTAANSNNYFVIIAAFNGTQNRTTLTYPILESAPTRFVLAFMRSRVELEEDVVEDRAIVYSLNITHVGDARTRRFGGGGRECVACPSRDAVTNQCQPCPVGHYLSEKNACTKCPFGTALNLTSSRRGVESCIKCGTNLGSDDGTECTFSGRFELNSTMDDGTLRTVQFDVSKLKERTLTAEGIRVFAREGNSYFHSFNVSLFGAPIRCRDSFDASAALLLRPPSASPSATPAGDQDYEKNALFCRSAAIPSTLPSAPVANLTNSANASKSAPPSSNLFSDVLFVSSTVISRRIAAVTEDRNFKGFHLSNDQLEYDSSLSSTARPMDVHVFYEPLPTRMPSCPLGTLGCGHFALLSRKCPDGTCDGCLYHVIIETALACPICHPNDFEEIRGECIDNLQKIHYIPSKHCVLSGAQNHERTEACSSVSDKVFLLLLFAALIITCLVIVVLVIYEKNKSLEYRYMRIVEGKDVDAMNSSCALKSDDEDEDGGEENGRKDTDTSKTRVFFEKKKNDYRVSLNKNLKNSKSETADFLSESSDDG